MRSGELDGAPRPNQPMHARTGEKANCTATGSWLKELGLEPHLRGPAAPTRGDTSLVGFDGEHQINGSAAWHRWRATHEFQASPGDCIQIVEQTNISKLFA
jgi:hypothetical protein